MTMWTIAGGVLLALLALRLIAGAIDWLDARTSQITPEEAQQRARLTMTGQWPPPFPRLLTAREFALSVMALALLWWASVRFR